MTLVSVEHELAGINVTRDTLDTACLAFGMPTRRESHDLIESDSHGAFTLAHVEWNLGEVSVAIVTRAAVHDEHSEQVVAIRVSGHGLGYHTGAGLKAGDSLAEAIRLYGVPQSVDAPSFRLGDGGLVSLTMQQGRVSEIQVISPWLAAGMSE